MGRTVRWACFLGLVGCATAPDSAQPVPLLPTPHGSVIVEDACMPSDLVNNAAYLFWIACDGSIRRAAKADGTVEIVAANEPDAAMLAVDDNFVYWMRDPQPETSDSVGQLVRLFQLGGTPMVLADAQKDMFAELPEQLILDDTNVYRSTFNAILGVPKDGSAPQQQIAIGNAGPFLAQDGEYLYWANASTIDRQRKGTSVTEQLVQTHAIVISPIAVTATGFFYWDQDILHRIDKATAAVTLFPVSDPEGQVLVADDTSLYWLDGGVVRFDDDGTVTVLAVDGSPGSLTVDSEFVYWTSGDQILATRKNRQHDVAELTIVIDGCGRWVRLSACCCFSQADATTRTPAKPVMQMLGSTHRLRSSHPVNGDRVEPSPDRRDRSINWS